MIATRVVRSLAVSAASGLVLRDGFFHVVADDETALFVFGPQSGTRCVPLLADALPDGKAARKARKPDLEILVDLPGQGLLAMGSGSRPTRERAVLVDRHERVTVIDTSALCGALRGAVADLNLEGAAVAGNDFVLLQRGNGGEGRNALVFIAMHDLLQALATHRFELTRAPRVVPLALGGVGDVPWTCTDLHRCEDGDLLASAVLEDTRDAYRDGACLGTALVRLAPDGALRWLRRLDTPAKVEGLAVVGQTVWMVSDGDDRDVSSQLLTATLPD